MVESAGFTTGRKPHDEVQQVSPSAGRGSLLGKLVLPLVLAAAVYLVLLLYGRIDELGVAMRDFRLVYLLPVLALVLVNYWLRFARWHYYLRRSGASVPWRESAAVFFSGFAVSITPARAGELLKCLLLRDEAGVSMSVSVPVVVADRVNDLVAVCLLVAAGMLRYSAARGASLIAMAAVAALVVALGFSPWIAEGATRVFARRFAGRSPAPGAAVREAADVFAVLLRGRALLLGTALGVLAWFAECAALYLVLGGLGSWTLTLYATTFVYALSTLAGALSLLPGGLGVTEPRHDGAARPLRRGARDGGGHRGDRAAEHAVVCRGAGRRRLSPASTQSGRSTRPRARRTDHAGGESR